MSASPPHLAANAAIATSLDYNLNWDNSFMCLTARFWAYLPFEEK